MSIFGAEPRPPRPLAQRAARLLGPLRRLHDARDALLAERDGLQSIVSALRAERDLVAAERDRARAAHAQAEAQRDQARAECAATLAHAAFHAYDTVLDVPGTVARHAAPGRHARPGLLTNFLDVAIPPDILPAILAERAGTLEPVPLPANWHADQAEWAGALRAVELSGERFTMIELGCGWGCWINNMGAAARASGRTVSLIGIEADPTYVALAERTLALNGFAPADWTLHRGVAAAAEGWALFPRQDAAGRAYGLEPVFGASEQARAEALAAGTHDVLAMVPLARAAAPHARIDLLHVDIQGGEAALLGQSLDLLAQKVAYIVVGTHSRPIEGELRQSLAAAGFRLEIERTAIYDLTHQPPMLVVDGVQAWRNPALTPAADAPAPG